MNLAPPLFSVLPRSRSSAALLAAALVMAAVATTLVAAVPLYADAIVQAGVRSTIADAPPAEGGIEATFRADGAALDATLDRLERVASARLPGRFDTLAVVRTDTYSLPDALAVDDDGRGRITSIGVLTGGDDLLVATAPPRRAGPGTVAAVLHVDAARELGLDVGDRIELGRRGADPIEIELVATVAPADVADRRWFDQPAVRDGATTNGSFTEVGPFLVDPETFAGLGGTANHRWRLLVDPASVSTSDLVALERGAAGIERAIGDAVDVTSLDVTTRLPDLVAATDTAVGATSAVIAAILLQLVGVALYGVGLAASVLASSRVVETSMLRSRGATPGQLGAMAAAEAVLIAVPAAVAGPWLAVRVVELVERWGPVAAGGLDLQPRVSALAVLLSAVVGVLVVGVVAWPAVRSARGFARSQAARSRPEGPLLLQRSGLDVAIVLLAVLGLWRLRGARAATSDLAGRLGTDPVLVLAPTLGVVAASLVTLRLIALVAAVSQRYTASQGALPLALAGWELARRPARTARTSVLIVLSVTVGAFAAVHGASWERSQRDQADAAVTTDLVVQPDARPSAAVASAYLPAAYAAVPGTTAVVPVDRPTATWSASLGSVPVVVTDVRALPEVSRLRDDLVDGVDWSALHAPGDLTPIELTPIDLAPIDGVPAAGETAGTVAGDLEIDFAVTSQPSAARGDIDVTVTLLDGTGSLVRIDGDPIPLDGGDGTIVFPLTSEAVAGRDLALRPPLRLLELELSVPSVRADPLDEQLPAHARFDVALGPARVGAAEVALESAWVLDPVVLPNAIEPADVAARPGPGLSLTVDTGLTEQNSADLVVRAGTAGVGQGEGFTMPALVTPALLTEGAVRVGDVVTVRIGGASVSVEVVGTVPVMPFAAAEERAVLLDWETYNVDRWSRGRRLEVPDAWGIAAEPGTADAIRATVAGEPFDSVAVLDRAQRATDIARAPVTVGLSGSLGLAIVASLVVAAMGLVLTAVVGARERRPAFAVLRALGTRAGELRRWLLLETLPLVGVSAAAGAVSGITLARLGLAGLALGSDGERSVPSPQLVVPWGTLAVIVAIAAAAGMALPLATARLLRRHRTADELRIGDTS